MAPDSSFHAVSIILPVINETYSFIETVKTILRTNNSDVKEFIAVVCTKTTQGSLEICNTFKNKLGDRFIIHRQKLPHLGGAIREAFEIAQGSHVMMMASDLETNPEDVKSFVEQAKRAPQSIITASRWLKGGGFYGYDRLKGGGLYGYNRLKLYCNSLFQSLFSRLYGVQLTDMTFGYRIFPTLLVRTIEWEELQHPFLFETIVKPLRLGTNIIEIPSSWKARTEGVSQNTFLNYFKYFITGIKVRFYSREKISEKAKQDTKRWQ